MSSCLDSVNIQSGQVWAGSFHSHKLCTESIQVQNSSHAYVSGQNTPEGKGLIKESNHTTELHATTNYTLFKLTHILLHTTKQQTSMGTSTVRICSSLNFILIFIFIENSILWSVMSCSLTEICQCSYQSQGLRMTHNFVFIIAVL